jgi:hypothetical protein
MQHQETNADRIIGRIATRSKGIVTRGELLAAGITREAVRQRLNSGALIWEYPGVYRVGHRAPSTAASYLAAVRACGERALLGGRAAAHHMGLIRGPVPPPEVILQHRRRVRGIRIRRSRVIEARDRWIYDDIPTTRPAWTIVDLAEVLDEEELARAFHEAHIKHGTKPHQVADVLARRPNTPGAAKLRRVVVGDTPVLLSRMEKRFRVLLGSVGLDLPLTNIPVGGHYVDCRWPQHRLTVELDSYRYHSSRYAWERDRQREREARARGDRFRRYTSYDVFDSPGSMLAELTSLMSPVPSPPRPER